MPNNKAIGPQAPGYYAETKDAEADDPRHPQVQATTPDTEKAAKKKR